ncbi:MAG: hypothetical protein H7831_00680 [Magnetococcus sp. WYHC-3]
MATIQAEVETLLHMGVFCPHQKMSAPCTGILGVAPALWTFVRVPWVDPINNAPGRDAPPTTLWREIRFEIDSDVGSRFSERILTVAEICRLQGCAVLNFQVQAMEAELRANPAPLAPAQAG